MKPQTIATSILLSLLLFFGCSNNENRYSLPLHEKGYHIYLHPDTDELIKWAAQDLALDLEKITGKETTLHHSTEYSKDLPGLYIGMCGSGFLTRENPTDLCSGQWETFALMPVEESLIVEGSDVRGTVYGIFDFAEKVGISPWKWWADVPLPKRAEVSIQLPDSGYVAGPSVQYRGIFINDEDWGLQPWAAKTFEPDVGDMGPRTYEKIFQLLLRLKANTIWPAMHPSTSGFFTIPGNKEIAGKYKIMVGTSHAEPMLRNNVDEWDNKKYGEYNYFTNEESVREYWKSRIQEVQCDNSIITLGMRGIHDSGMQGGESTAERIDLLERIITDQQAMLRENCDLPPEQITQILVPYKEVLDLYNAGLHVPDEVTLMWTDDNYGYIRRLSSPKEQKRAGGSGVYYHLSYWGRPHDYLWLSSTQPALIWYEMSRAYQNGAQKIWIANVGDIKPAAYNLELFMDLAWNVNDMNASSVSDHLKAYFTREFGSEASEKISEVLQEYYRLAMLRKPEFMGWSQTEPTTQTGPSEFLSAPFGELNRRLMAYQSLYAEVSKLKAQTDESHYASFFQLVEYPVKSAALMNYKFLYAQKSYEATSTAKKQEYDALSKEAFRELVELTKKYNSEISEGKWQYIMDMAPRELPVFQQPTYHTDTPPRQPLPIPPQATFAESIYINASDYFSVSNSENYKWQIIDGLGYSGRAITVSPFQNHTFANEPSLTYKFSIEHPGRYRLQVRCLPTHSNDGDHSITVRFNNSEPSIHAINTRGRSEEWKRNVLRNFQSVLVVADFEKGENIVEIKVNQTGIVIDQLAIISEGLPLPYEIPASKK